jgi:hypothetical protein
MRAPLLMAIAAMLASCGQAPSEKAPTKQEQTASPKANGAKANSTLADKEVKAEKKSIEEAAEAAAKLVEEEMRTEIEAQKTQ